MNIYIATPLACAWQARELAKDIKAAGYDVVSSWHEKVMPGDVDPKSMPSRKAILNTNLDDLAKADAVVVDLRHEDSRPRATYCEAAYALAQGKSVVWLYDGEGSATECIFDAHPLSCVARGEFQLANVLRGMG